MAPAKPTFAPNAGDLVFAKLKGYPFWPARIESVSPYGVATPIPKGKRSVFFFGTYEMANIALKDIIPFEINKEKYGKNKAKEFVRAMKEIQETPEIKTNPINQLVVSETLSTVQTTNDGEDTQHETSKDDDDVNASSLIVEALPAVISKPTKSTTASSSRKKKEETQALTTTSNKKPAKRKSTIMVVKMDFQSESTPSTSNEKSSAPETPSAVKANDETSEIASTLEASSSKKRKTSQSVKKPSNSKRKKKDKVGSPQHQEKTLPVEQLPSYEEPCASSIPLPFNPNVVVNDDVELSTPVELSPVGKTVTETLSHDVEQHESIPDPEPMSVEESSEKEESANEAKKDEKSKKDANLKEEVKSDKDDKKSHSLEEASSKKNSSKKKEVLKMKTITNGDESRNKKEEHLRKEKLRLEKKEQRRREKYEQVKKEKKLRKLEEKRQKRLEELKSKPVTKQLLKDIDSEIVESLEVSKLNIPRCINALRKLDILNVTQKVLSEYPELIGTLKVCKRFKPDEVIRTKSSYLFNKFKNMFSNGLEEGLVLPKTQGKKVEKQSSDGKSNNEKSTKDHSTTQSTESPPIMSAENPDVSCSVKTREPDDNNKKPKSTSNEKEPIKESTVQPTQESELEEVSTTEAMHDTKDNEQIESQNRVCQEESGTVNGQLTSCTSQIKDDSQADQLKEKESQPIIDTQATVVETEQTSKPEEVETETPKVNEFPGKSQENETPSDAEGKSGKGLSICVDEEQTSSSMSVTLESATSPPEDIAGGNQVGVAMSSKASLDEGQTAASSNMDGIQGEHKHIGQKSNQAAPYK